MQPILKSNSTSLMFNTIFCVMGKKVIHLGGGPGGNGRTVLISSWKCNFIIYLDIQVYYFNMQAITRFYAFYWFFMCWFLLFIHFSMLQPLSWKVTFSSTQKPTPPIVSTYRHQTGFILKRKQVRITIYLCLPINW